MRAKCLTIQMNGKPYAKKYRDITETIGVGNERCLQKPQPKSGHKRRSTDSSTVYVHKVVAKEPQKFMQFL